MSTNDDTTAFLIGGAPSENTALFHRIRFSAGDPAAWIRKPDGRSLLLIRDIEADRARRDAKVDEVSVPADFTPQGGLSGDRATATAQATAECLRRLGMTKVILDRSTPYIYAHHLERAGLDVGYDEDLGVKDRRSKSVDELKALHQAQSDTESVMHVTLQRIAHADIDAEGRLVDDEELLTSERVRRWIDVALLELGYDNPGSIVAGGPDAFDCHAHGTGPLRTGEPVIVDIFPHSKSTGYNGDCTRTVVHGAVPDSVRRMHEAVVAAKAAGIAAVRPGVTGEEVHRAPIDVIAGHGYEVGLPPKESPLEWCGMVHGTGHGVGLQVHEPPLLDFNAPELIVGDVLTIEPGLYSAALGGIRVEDMVAVTEAGCQNFNRLPEGLIWI
jgi:Xaa-Pro aminopeptidase